MADDNKYPKSSPGVAKLFNMNQDNTELSVPDSTPLEDTDSSAFAPHTAPPPAGLPISVSPVETPNQEPTQTEEVKSLPIDLKPINSEKNDAVAEDIKLEPLDLGDDTKPTNPIWRFAKMILPWVAIFAIGLGLYFFYFSDFSFQSLFNSDTLKIESVANDTTNANLEELKKTVAADYKTWISQFFADVTDESIIAMDADVSGNGLTNLEKYLLNLNPKVYSTRGNIGDGQSVLEGTNPWTGKPFTDKQKELISKYINPELISNRITAAAITRGVTKYSQYVNPDSPYYIDPATLSQVGDGTNPVVNPTQINTANVDPIRGSTGGNTVAVTPAPKPTNTTSSSAPTNLKPDETIDQTKPGLLQISANGITVPLIWTKDVKDFDNDLKRGVVHYPGTALPGEVGTSYISGHSSGYVWDKSAYKQIFSKLGSVADGTSFTITVTLKNGKTVKYNYVVDHRGEYAANDQSQFISTADSIVALSTCWPVGTVDHRLVLFGKLTQTERN